MPTLRPFSAGQFELMIDGHPTRAYVKSAEGGFIKQNVADEGLGAMVERVKHGTTVEVEPISLEVGMAQANTLLLWIAQSWRKSYSRKNGSIIHADSNYKAQFVQEFKECLIEEVTIPQLDSNSKDPAILKIKLRPEWTSYAMSQGSAIGGTSSSKQKLWSAAAFRLVLDSGVSTQGVAKIDSFTVKQGIKPVPAGAFRLPQLEPTSVTFPDLKITQSLAHAGGVLDWYNKVVVQGQHDDSSETTGAIEFLNNKRDKVLFRIKLTEVGIKSFNIPKTEAGKDEIKRCTYDLYVGSMEIDDQDDLRLGLED